MTMAVLEMKESNFSLRNCPVRATPYTGSKMFRNVFGKDYSQRDLRLKFLAVSVKISLL